MFRERIMNKTSLAAAGFDRGSVVLDNGFQTPEDDR